MGGKVYEICDGSELIHGDMLETKGQYASTYRDSEYFIEDILRELFNCKGLVFYSVIEDDTDRIPYATYGEYIVELRPPATSNKIEIEFDLYHRTKAILNQMSCDVLTAIKECGIDRDYFESLAKIKGRRYIGVCDKITQQDVIAIHRVNDHHQTNNESGIVE